VTGNDYKDESRYWNCERVLNADTAGDTKNAGGGGTARRWNYAQNKEKMTKLVWEGGTARRWNYAIRRDIGVKENGRLFTRSSILLTEGYDYIT
jgi:hypothetical protein